MSDHGTPLTGQETGGASPSSTVMTARPSEATRGVSPTLFGLFLEDINFACDGGLNANLVNNYSFEGVYLVRGTDVYIPKVLGSVAAAGELPPRQPMTPAGRAIDRTRHWAVTGGRLQASDEDAIAAGASFARVESDGSARLENLGYPGDQPSMSMSGPLRFTALVRADHFEGDIEVRLVDAGGREAASDTIRLDGSGWQEVQARLVPSAAGLGALHIVLDGVGTLDLDEVKLIPENHWGAGDPRWSQGLLRRDLVEALEALAPRFLRFPGGCIVEGCGDGSHYKWKDTIGPLETRRPEYNLWGQFRPDGDYSQSNQVGFYEYFLLCEDLGIEPMPIVWAGVSCQFRTDTCVPLDSPEFAAIVQDTIDLIDWATGDPATNTWAALRAEAGHPEPFALNLIGIGNENTGPEYLARFQRIKQAVDLHRPGLTQILTSLLLEGEDFDQTWAYARQHGDALVVDEHYYQSPEWFLRSTDRYDAYPRGSAGVFIGEYAAHPATMTSDPEPIPADPVNSEKPTGPAKTSEPNTWRSALAEAAFLTGVERNSDVIVLTSYAPLFTLVEHSQWAHNLINFNPTAVMPTVNYLVQQLFGRNIGDKIVPLEGDIPAEVFASATLGSGTTYVKLVNVGSSPVDLSLHVDGATDGEASAISLQAPLDAANRLTFEGQPEIAVHPEESTREVRGGALELRLEPTSVLALSVRVNTPTS